MTDERALEVALTALHEKRRSGLGLPMSMTEVGQAIFVLEGLLAIAKQFDRVAG